MKNRIRVVIGILAFSAATATSREASAQIVGIHGIYVPGTDGRPASTGVQADLGGFIPFPFTSAMLTLAGEYQRQQSLGPGRGRAALELRVLARNADNFIAPFIGGGISANQSNGEQSEWRGTLPGYEAMAGLILVPSDRAPAVLLLEERFGYVRDQGHATATHIGLMVRFH